MCTGKAPQALFRLYPFCEERVVMRKTLSQAASTKQGGGGTPCAGPRAAGAVALLIWSATVAWAAPSATARSAMPPPGEYRVDQEASTRSQAGPATLEVVQKTDGATGAVTQIRRSSVQPGEVTNSFPGTGPVLSCVRAGAPPAGLGAFACATTAPSAPATGNTTQTVTQCRDLRQADEWRRVDDRQWEHRFTVVKQPAASAGLAAMPAATAAAMAPVIAAMQERIRNGPPADAQFARQQLSALQGGPGAAGAPSAPANDTRTTVFERWTRVADTCSKAR